METIYVLMFCMVGYSCSPMNSTTYYRSKGDCLHNEQQKNDEYAEGDNPPPGTKGHIYAECYERSQPAWRPSRRAKPIEADEPEAATVPANNGSLILDKPTSEALKQLQNR